MYSESAQPHSILNGMPTSLRAFLVTAIVLASGAEGQAQNLKNGGFEAASTAEHWTPHGDHPDDVSVSRSEDAKEGSRSLLVEAAKPVRFSLDQEVFLRPGSLWRASVWIKYESGTGAPALEVDTPSGQQGASVGTGNAREWREHAVVFRAPSPGRIDIRLRAFANNSGKVWFDDVRLVPVSERVNQPERVTITGVRMTDRPIDLKQGGQFIEPLIRLTSSMIAQQVESTSFEEEPPWRPAYKAAVDKPFRPWYPDGAVHVAVYSFDTQNAFNGKRSQKIDLPQAGVWAGISQDGYYLEHGHSYRLKLHMRGNAPVPVRAFLHGEGGAIAGPMMLGKTAENWAGAEVVLTAARDCSNATLTIEFQGPGTLWLDRVYLLDSDAVLGIWRRDLVDALKAMKPGVIRFGGSTLEVFEWDRCIGDWDKRVPYATEPWGGLDPNFIGVEEFVQLAQHVGAEPLVCMRWTGKKPEDAFVEVQYFNGAADSHWGGLRARNGHPQPYGVKYWQIGNEIGGPTYDASVKAFAEAMRKADSTVKVLSSFPSAETLMLGGGYLDYLCPHHYDVGNLNGTEDNLKSLEQQIREHSGGKDIRVAVTEWNTTAGEWGLTRGILQTLGNALACSRYQNMLHRYSSLVEIAIRSNLSDSFGSGVLQPGPGWLYLAPTYYSQQLYQRAAGSFPLRIERTSPLDGYLREPDLSATAGPDGTLRIFAVNSTNDPRTVDFQLAPDVRDVTGGKVFVLHDTLSPADSEAMNSRDQPHRISVSETPAQWRGRRFQFTFEPYTVTLIEL
jgi:alpha-N-arabinofuranosidase